MLINALCEYYDQLEREGKLLPEGYSRLAVHYIIELTPDGKLDRITDKRIRSNAEKAGGKKKETTVPSEMIFPKRTEKPGIDANLIEHRPMYIFGLNYDKGVFSPDDKTNKARKSHEAFVQKNLGFIEGLDSPVINAYRNFIMSWVPDNETENPVLLQHGKEYKSSSYAFCVSGSPETLLQDDPMIKARFDEYKAEETEEEKYLSQCAVTGERLPIARIHDKIKGLSGGLPTGTVMIGCETVGCSYGNKRSFNCNISETAMKKYTFAMNTLLADKRHRIVMDGITIIDWAVEEEKCSEIFDLFFNGTVDDIDPDRMDKTQTEQMLKDTFRLAKEGRLTADRISDITGVDENVDFYIAGLKPNSSRVSIKFIYRRRFADILYSIAQHQADIYIQGMSREVPLWMFRNELKSPKIKEQNVSTPMMAAIFKSVIYGTPYPSSLLSTLVMRVKTDRSIGPVRAGAIKGCINRQSRALNKKEELTVALSKNNTNQAYLCGRLFAVLERIQEQAASPAKLNRTIKDSFFATASSKPSMVFPKLITLSQNHMRKLDDKSYAYYNILIEEIIGMLEGEFPDTLMLTEQGKFMIGYYHQVQDFYTKKNKEEN